MTFYDQVGKTLVETTEKLSNHQIMDLIQGIEFSPESTITTLKRLLRDKDPVFYNKYFADNPELYGTFYE